MKSFQRILMSLMLALAVMSTAYGSAKKEKDDAGEARTFYMEIKGTTNPVNGSITVILNLGNMLSGRTGLTPVELRKASREKKFNSMVDAMNELAQYGWKLENIYTVNVRSNTTVYWVVSKEVYDPMELLDGFVE